MNPEFVERLNKILPRLVSDELLEGRGQGNEISFHIFHYPPEYELEMRRNIDLILTQIAKQRPGLKVAHVKLFDLVIDHLRDRKLLKQTIKMQREKGDDEVLNNLRAPLAPEKLAPVFVKAVESQTPDLILVSRVGSAYPLVRTHGLLNSLHSKLGRTPLVLFFPGNYDGLSLSLFGRLRDNNYYRAFKLVP